MIHINHYNFQRDPPKIVENPNNATPLTAYINFKSNHPVDSVIVKINDGERETILKYHQRDKPNTGTWDEVHETSKKAQHFPSSQGQIGKSF